MKNLLILQIVILVVYHAMGEWFWQTPPPKWTIDQSCTVTWQMIETNDHDKPYHLTVTQYYSASLGMIKWHLPQQDSYVKWSLKDQVLTYVFPTYENSIEKHSWKRVRDPFLMNTLEQGVALSIMYPDLSNYTPIRNENENDDENGMKFSTWFSEGLGQNNEKFISTVKVAETQWNPEIVEVVNEGRNMEGSWRTVTSFNYQYGEPDEAVWGDWNIAYDLGDVKGTKEGNLPEEAVVRDFLIGDSTIWPYNALVHPGVSPSVITDRPSLRSGFNHNTSFPYDEEEYEFYSYPEVLDWNKCQAVSEVKNQFRCSACASFTIVGVLESAHFIHTDERVDLAVQAVIDCAWGQGNQGCLKGEPESIFKWVIENQGLPKTEQYGFKQFRRMNGRCEPSDPKSHAARITSWTKIPSSVNALKMALLRHGPVLVGVTVADLATYNIYQDEGVIRTPMNTSEEISHAGQVIGWNVSPLGVPYWIVKNTWGRGWGFDGYYFVEISKERNPLGLLNQMMYVNMGYGRKRDTYFEQCDTYFSFQSVRN